MTREPVDFFIIRPGHEEVHAQLLNWAQWSLGGNGGSSMNPMFREYRNDYFQPTASRIDSLAAVATQKVFVKLPEKHRWCLNWAYVRPYIPRQKVKQALGLTTPALAELLHDARSMMKNLQRG